MKDIEQNITEEYERFIEFGNLLDRKSRRYLVEYFRHKIDQTSYQPPTINDQYFKYFQSALENIFAIDHLLPLIHGNRRISQHVVLDTLHWIRKTFTKVRSQNPFKEEEDLLKGWAVTPLKIFTERYPFLLLSLIHISEPTRPY